MKLSPITLAVLGVGGLFLFSKLGKNSQVAQLEAIGNSAGPVPILNAMTNETIDPVSVGDYPLPTMPY